MLLHNANIAGDENRLRLVLIGLLIPFLGVWYPQSCVDTPSMTSFWSGVLVCCLEPAFSLLLPPKDSLVADVNVFLSQNEGPLKELSIWIHKTLASDSMGHEAFPKSSNTLAKDASPQISGLVPTNRGKQDRCDASHVTGESQTGGQKILMLNSPWLINANYQPITTGTPPWQRPPLYAHKLAVITQFVVRSWVLRLAASAGLLFTCCSGLLLLLALGFDQERWTWSNMFHESSLEWISSWNPEILSGSEH